MEGAEVTLEEMLRFREQKVVLQMRMSRETPDAAVISLGMNIPGPVKCSPLIEEVFREGMDRLEELFGRQGGVILQKCLLQEKGGYAAVYCVRNTAGDAIKRETSRLEEMHPVGRLWDIDLIRGDGSSVSRTAIGREGRKCLICGQDARVCGRSRAHSVRELQDKVAEMITEWKKTG